MSVEINCGTVMSSGMMGSTNTESTYTLSGDNNTLTITPTSGGSMSSTSFMRRM
jgi:hypothetical protein